MLAWILLQAVALASHDPRLLNDGGLAGPDDYPQEALAKSLAGVATVAVGVSDDGKVIDCAVVETSRASSLDLATCRVVRRRAKFVPATDQTGQPVAGVYYLATSWGVNADQPRVTIDLVLKTPKLPTGYVNPAKLMALFDATGHVMKCEVRTTSGNARADQIACQQAAEQIVIAPPIAKGGVEARAVRYPTVSFEQP